MSEEVGFVAVQPVDGAGPLLPGVSETSEATQQIVDNEVRRIIDEAQDEVRNLLERERDKLDALAEALLREETLDEARRLPGGRDRPGGRPRVSELAEVVARALAEDLGAGDLTAAAVVDEDARALARIEQREPGVLYGLDVARETFAQADPALAFDAHAAEGEWRDGGEVVAIEGPARGDPRRRARGAELPRPPVGRGHAHGPLRARASRAPAPASSTPARPRRACARWRRPRWWRAAACRIAPGCTTRSS